jgi:hypothetical protein
VEDVLDALAPRRNAGRPGRDRRKQAWKVADPVDRSQPTLAGSRDEGTSALGIASRPCKGARLMSSAGDNRPRASSALSPVTIAFASLGSVVATVLVSRFGLAGTVLGAALAPVVVTLVSELGRRPVERVARLPAGARAVVSRRRRPGVRWGLVALSSAVAFAVAVAFFTVPDLIRGESVVSDRPTTFFGSPGDGSQGGSDAPATTAPATTAPQTPTAPAETAPEAQPPPPTAPVEPQSTAPAPDAGAAPAEPAPAPAVPAP